jgi:O-antigen ligase
MPSFPLACAFDPDRGRRIADALMAATAMSLPWSTTATGILVVLWLLVLIPAIALPELRRLVFTPAGALPVLLVLLGAAGTLWADVSWAERWEGLVSFSKLLAIPVLFLQFSRSARGPGVFAAYLVACLALLFASFLLVLWPSLPHTAPDYGVMVKNAASQSGEFVICIAGLLYIAHEAFGRRSYGRAAAAIAAMLAVLADIVFVANGRTALVMLLVLLLLFALTRLSLRSAVIFVGAAAALVVVAWMSSSYLRARVEQIWTDAQAYERTDVRNSSGERIEFAKTSLTFIRGAPLIGHGTGSIHAQFENAAAGYTGAQGVASTNPHNQTLAVGIQFGLLGVAVLWAMWIAHLLMFRGAGLAAWVGLLIVVQNILGSMFNSHLSDFLQGWTYVVGVGVAGGMVLRARGGKSA